MTELITYTIDNYVAVVTMNNPPVNAQNGQFYEEMIQVMDALSDMSECRSIVLTGAGKVFSAGADMRARVAVGAVPGDKWAHNRRARESFHAIRECKKPVVGALNGPALGAGLGVAASCDILVAAEEASLGLPEINVGLMGGGKHAQRLFGHSTLRRMMLTGYRVPGKELYRLGVVEACVPREQLMDVAMEFGRDLASKSPFAMRLAKETLNAIEDMTLRDGYRYEQNMTVQLRDHPDSKEAAAAFFEKRPAKYSE
jgi:enoyl-CoA hydratase/carnithine racemase